MPEEGGEKHVALPGVCGGEKERAGGAGFLRCLSESEITPEIPRCPTDLSASVCF